MKEGILITGGAGFIGFHLARRLVTAGYRVCLADNHVRGIFDRDLKTLVADPGITFVEVDLLDQESVLKLGEEFFAIYHLGAIIGVQHVLARPYDVLVNNTRMLDNVIALGKSQKNLSRLLFASSSEIYAGTLHHFDMLIPTAESTPLAIADLDRPRSSYMLSKIMGEALVHQAGLPFTIFRPHNIYGPRMGMAHVIPEQLKKIFDANLVDLIEVFSPTHTRTFCYVDDAVEMLHRMLTTEACVDETLNLGTEDPEVTIREVVQVCIDVTGKKLRIVERTATPGSPPRRAPDMQKTNKLLGFKSRVGLRDGIERTWNWYYDSVFNGNGSSAQ